MRPLREAQKTGLRPAVSLLTLARHSFQPLTSRHITRKGDRFLLAVRPRTWRQMTSQGSAHGRFKRAIKQRNPPARRWRCARWGMCRSSTRSTTSCSRRVTEVPHHPPPSRARPTPSILARCLLQVNVARCRRPPRLARAWCRDILNLPQRLLNYRVAAPVDVDRVEVLLDRAGTGRCSQRSISRAAL